MKTNSLLKGLNINDSQFLKIARVLISGNSYDRMDYVQKLGMGLDTFIQELVKQAEHVLYDIPSSHSSSLSEYFITLVQENHWDLAQLLSQSHHFQVLFSKVFQYLLLDSSRLPLPIQFRDSIKQTPRVLIDRDLLFLLDCALESDIPNRRWRLIYSSERDGKSWTMLRQKLVEVESSVIIVKDSHGKVFGGFYPIPFIPNPKFTGNSHAFVFTGNPLRLYRPTRINENFVYYNHGQQTLPNGIGFGGQLDYFGWFVSSDLESGHSMAQPTSTTFGNPQLSQTQFFTLDQLEVWCIVDRDTESVSYKKSVLENPEMIAILEMSGKTMYSKEIGDPGKKETDL